jgi:predicted NAD/FAD-binding protein
MTLNIAVIGSGISGLSAAWLLSRRHRVTLYESAPRLGGHTNTVAVTLAERTTHVDTGFIVYNEATYPNLAALFAHLRVPTAESEMSFGVSLRGGRLEYEGTNLRSLFVQGRNLLRPRFWSMILDILRFYRSAPAKAAGLPPSVSLGDFLEQERYGIAFQEDHLLPMAAAIWSAPIDRLRAYPAAHFVRFCDNHGLLRVADRPIWRTVQGGARTYIDRMLPAIAETRIGCAVTGVKREIGAALVTDATGETRPFDHVVLACHGDQALRLLRDPTSAEETLLGAFRTSVNKAILHTDARFMPKRKGAWASWNYLGGHEPGEHPQVTYWMNRLQPLGDFPDLFVTLNPAWEPEAGSVLREEEYRHPLFDAEAMRAQSALWSLQGQRHTWFCGAWFGSGFHEDGLQAGLAVAEALGGVRRPWAVANESGRIALRLAA